MGEGIKNRVVLVLGVICLVLFISNVSSCMLAQRSKGAFNKEMSTRMDLEEKMSKFTQEKTLLEAKVAKLTQDFEQEKNEHKKDSIKLNQDDQVIQSLKEELQKLNNLNDKLEEDLKAARVTSKSTKNKMK